MRIIQISGWSGSGKTTFILGLLEVLSRLGTVGTIKHIGDHICDLPAGKDTTLHYLAGASVSIGIDQKRTLITRDSLSLFDALDMLADTGVEYAVVEGFKQVPFRKVVIGDLNLPCLIRDPTIEGVITHLNEFDEYSTLGGLVSTAQKSMSHPGGDEPGKRPGDGVILSSICWYGAGIKTRDSYDLSLSESSYSQFMRTAHILGTQALALPGQLDVRISLKCRVFSLPVPVYVVVAGEPHLAGPAFSHCMKGISHLCRSGGDDLHQD
ncbi:MAG TPA: molybdopterin-guanine dinucleotide biosynthesis protein B [Methanospirillum sp.]|nr:molybdopterin-guanine dinucleotide biosynthesis protein B [Methanospirillum sp.]